MKYKLQAILTIILTLSILVLHISIHHAIAQNNPQRPDVDTADQLLYHRAFEVALWANACNR